MQDFNTLEKRMLVWWDKFRQYGIPMEHYKTLFDMAFDIRQQKMATEKEAPLIDAPLIISCWTRPHGLKAQLEEERVRSGRLLTDTAASGCERCFGTGMENKFDIDGKVIGVVTGRPCDHRPIDPGEIMFKKKPANVVVGEFEVLQGEKS